MPAFKKPPYLAAVRELVRAYQAFERVSGNHIRTLGLTPPQFDVIATLGNTPGMSCKELSEKTLITKGTLTGILDRLIDKALISRHVPEHDRRSVFVALTPAGEALFAEAFPAQLAYMQAGFEDMDNEAMEHLTAQLAMLRHRIDAIEKDQK